MSVSKTKTFRNILYTGFGKGLTLVCVFLTSLVVARNLTPSDYGVVGFAGIVIGFLSRFSDMGLVNAAIQRADLSQREARTAFTLKILLSLGAFLVAFLVAPFAHYFFAHPATANVIRLLAFNFLLSSIGFVPQVILTREMNFRTLMIPGVTSAVVQSSLAIVLVLNGWSFWSVITANIGATLASGIVLQIARRVPISFGFDWALAKDLLRFGLPIFGSGVLIFIIFNLDNFLVGASLGSVQLGYYAIAFTWGAFICGLLTATVHSVLFPAFSAIRDDAVAGKRWYLKTVELVGFIAVVANTSLFANARPFLVTFLGKGTDKWLPAVLPLQILCMYGILRAITEPLGPAIMASGRTKIMLRATLLAGAAEVGLLFLALRTGQIALVAAVVMFAYGLQAVIYVPFLKRQFSIGLTEIGATIWPIVPAFLVGWAATSFLPLADSTSVLALFARFAFTATAVALAHGLLSRFRCFIELQHLISHSLVREVSQ